MKGSLREEGEREQAVRESESIDEKKEGKKRIQKSHPVRRPGGSRLLDRPLDALKVAVKVQRPLVEVAGRESGNPPRHCRQRKKSESSL